jgi:poly(3-hydroxybutyrate) depolymerase
MKTLNRFVFLLSPLLIMPLNSVADDQDQVQSNGVVIVTLGERRTVNEMAIFPQGGIPDRPLLIAAHGGGGSGPKEIEGWLALAKQHNFTIVCPTFLSGMTHSMYVPMDVPYFKDCLHWIEDNLKYDKSNVYMTGFSGGGYPVWYLATTRPDFFKGLFLQSGNFAGQYYDLNLSGWANKPIHLVWGTEDSPTVMAQNKQAVDLLQSKGFKNFTTEIIPGAHHKPHHDLVVNWMEQQMAAPSSN